MSFRSSPRVIGLLALCVTGATAGAQSKPLPLKHVATPTTVAITPADLMSRLYVYADDSMMGRLAGTEWNLKATQYIADELKKMGMKPGGENGTYFQNVPILHLQLSATRPITVDGKNFTPTKDFIPRSERAFGGAQAIYGGMFGDTAAIAPDLARGKVVLLSVPNGPDGRPLWSGTRIPSSRRYPTAAAVAIIGMDGMVDTDWKPLMADNLDQLDVPAPAADPANAPPQFGFMYIRKGMAEAMLGGSVDAMKPGTLGKMINGAMGFDTTRRIARNVIGIIPGSDPKLRGQYVALGAHNDHVGFGPIVAEHDSIKAFNMVTLPAGADSVPRTMTPERILAFQKTVDSLRKIYPSRPDSIFNGADDDGSGTVSVLEIAEAFQKSAVKPKRSLIFVWHTGEELGLFGSEWFTDHPTIPRDSIVAQLNMDMVGRGDATDVTGKTKGPVDSKGVVIAEGDEIHGNPDYVQLVGSRRLSTELGDLIETVNTASKKPLKFDYSIDANGHPSSIYCRSDHYSYARYGIPITFFTTGGHSDYHQLTDEPQYIDYEHMSRVATMVMNVATKVADLDHRVVVDKAKPDPKGQCIQ